MREPISLQEWAGARDNAMTTLALAFTDIVNSTVISNQLGDMRWIEIVMNHFSRAEEHKDIYRGYEIKRIGDAYMAAFRTGADAFRFVWQFAMNAGEYPSRKSKERILIRAGIHVGQVRIVDNDIYGRMVNYTSRVQHTIEGPGIALSETAKEELVAEMGEESDRYILRPRKLNIKSFGGKTVWRVLPGKGFQMGLALELARLVLLGERTQPRPLLLPVSTKE